MEDPSLTKLDSATLKANVNALHCFQFSKSAWDSISSVAIRNSWRNARFKESATECNKPLAEQEVGADLDFNTDIAELEQLDHSELYIVIPSKEITEIVSMLQEEANSDVEDV